MPQRQAIRNEGERAEEEFLNLVKGAKKSNNAKFGDIIVTLDGSDHYVEVKECHAGAGKGGTINQVRAVKFITCVVWAPKHHCWYILSPDQLVRLASTKSRGQHTEIPFECMNFTLSSLSPEFYSKATDAELNTKVKDAIQKGIASDRLRELMISLLDEIIKVKNRYIAAVREEDDK